MHSTTSLRPTPISLALTAALTSLLGTGPALAADAPTAELPPVTVSAGRGATLRGLDVSTTVITHEQVQQAPETTIEQIVNRIPGAFSLQQPAGQLHPTAQVFSIRGFGTTTNVNTLLMVDGVPVNDPYFRTIDWGQIPKDSIERIEVIRGGGATSLWGNLAMGGIINIVTREPKLGEKRVSLSYGSFNTVTADAAATLLANDTLKVGLNVGVTRSDGYQQTPAEFGNPRMSATQSETDNLLLSAVLTPTAGSRYYLKGFAHQSREQGLTWDVTRNTWSSYRLLGGGSTQLDATSSVNFTGWVASGEMDTTNAGQSPAYNNTTPTLAVPYVSQIEQAKYRSLGASAFYKTRWGVIDDVWIGIDARTIGATDDLNLYNASAPTAVINARGQHRLQGLFAQGKYRAERVPLEVTLGLREDFWQATNASVNGVILSGPSTLSNPVANTSFNRFDPRLGAKYFLTDDLNVRAALYRNFAAPGMNQMYRSFVSGTSYTATSPTLRPQTNTGQEIGLDFKRSGIDVAVTLFDNKLDNFIDYAPMCTTVATCDPLITGTGLAAGSVARLNQYVNAGTAVLRGVELLGKFQLSPAVQLDGGLTRTQAYLSSSRFTQPAATPPVPTHKQLGQVPTWMATLGASWQATSAFSVSAKLKSFPSYWNNTAHTQRNESATLLDLGASYQLSKTLALWTSVQNVADRRYYDQGLTATTMEGSTASTSSIPALGMPRALTVGLRAAF
ncbi:MAG: TonB-dependent receptor [Burkholderiales bacterium]|nr:TonB-dependent receptor [Burkholderiales bacterium]